MPGLPVLMLGQITVVVGVQLSDRLGPCWLPVSGGDLVADRNILDGLGFSSVINTFV